jgi:lipoyl(octanoyl) transferase
MIVSNPNKEVFYKDLGLIDYKEAWDYQENIFNKIISIKVNNRSLPDNDQEITPNYILSCTHPNVYTLGKSGKENNLLIDQEALHSIDASFYKINRGGDITFHGPGQIVVYPILDLYNFFTDIHKYLRFLEQAVIDTLAEFEIVAGRVEGLTGVWIGMESDAPRKICAMGVRASRWVTMHGLALNVNNDLSYFNNIVPCGITDKAVTSIQKERNGRVIIEDVQKKLINNIARIFEMTLIEFPTDRFTQV